jgi:23S rRNA (cytosine1962-C5)-methyltransferase
MDMTLSEWFETQNFPEEDENLASSACLYLKKGAGRSLKSGGGWIYDNEVDRTEGSFDNGAILKILDFDGFPLGYGFINTASRIRVRMLSRYEKKWNHPRFSEAACP